MKKLLIIMLCAVMCVCMFENALATGDEPIVETESAAEELPNAEEEKTESAAQETPNTEGEHTEAPVNNSADPVEQPNEDPGEVPVIMEDTYLRIDDENIYPGMTRAYKNGYIPEIKDGKATIIVPIKASVALESDSITVTPDLGQTQNSPFVYGNYQKTVKLTDIKLSDSVTESVYLISLELPLISDRYDGVYPVILNINGRSASGNPVTYMTTVYVTITDGKDPNYEPQPVPVSQPKLIIDGVYLKPEKIMAGDEFEITVGIRNTSESNNVYNVTVTPTWDSEHFTVIGSGVEYIDKIPCTEVSSVTFKFKTDNSTEEKKYNLTFSMAYENSEATQYTMSQIVPVYVSQPLRVELSATEIAENVTAGETIPVSFQVMNLGRGAVYNVRCEIDGLGIIPNGTAFIGNLTGGTEGTGKVNVFIGSKTMNSEETEMYGETTVNVTLIYEDEQAVKYSEKHSYYITIEKPVIDTPDLELPNESTSADTAGRWIPAVVIGLVLVALTAGAIVIKIRRRK